MSLPAELVEAIVAEVKAQVLDELREHDGDGWPPYMSASTAAHYLDVSEERLRKLQARGEIPYCQEAPGCRVAFRRADLDAHMQSLRRGGA